MPVQSWAFTDVGRKRQHNEDAYLSDDAAGVYLVCDGMGGHAAGEVASAKAVEVVRDTFVKNAEVGKRLAKDPSSANKLAMQTLMEQAVQRACSEIYKLASSDSSKRGMGTTFVGMACAGDRAVIGHVGDSRIYLLRSGQVHRLTEDHTLVNAQIKAGQITKEQALTSQYRNVITRAVGIQESVQVDTLLVDLVPGDMYMLCSDGLHGYMADEETLAVLSQEPVAELPKKLIDLANNRGGKDNITAICLKIPGQATASAAATEANARFEALRRIPLFKHLSYKEQAAILAIATTRTYPGGREIVLENQPGEELFVVVGGRVSIEKNGVEIAELRAGGHFGEMGLIDNEPRSATVRATEPTRVMVVSRNDLMALMKKEPVLAVKLLWSFVQVLSDRLRAANSNLSEARQELAIANAVAPFIEE
jgi:serine/threonine protein phosphatase PrpC